MENYKFSEIIKQKLTYCNIKKIRIEWKDLPLTEYQMSANYIFEYIARKYASTENDYRKLGRLFDEIENNNLENKCSNYFLDLFNEKKYFRKKSLHRILTLLYYFGKEKNIFIFLELEDLDNETKEIKRIIRIDNLNDINLNNS